MSDVYTYNRITHIGVNAIINNEKGHMDVGKISDGYHTFDELYEHRCVLFMALCNFCGRSMDAWKSRLHADGSFYNGWFVAGMGKIWGNIVTYHVPISMWDDFKVEELDKAIFDGHDSSTVLIRLREWFSTDD